MDAVTLLLDQISSNRPKTSAGLRSLKRQVAVHTRQGLIRNDVLLQRYRQQIANRQRQPDHELERLLQLNRIRSESGIATVTVITKPYACPGRCIFCPTEARAPKSYLTNEPAVMRAIRNDYDPYRQVKSRLRTLDETGHPTDKIELIVKGGTWSFYPEGYQLEFIQRCLDAANDFQRAQRQGLRGAGEISESAECNEGLDQAQRRNETSPARIIGITIETRPDYINNDEIVRLRRLGVTRVELGVQTLEENVLRLIVRDHGTEEIRQATRQLKDAGFKIAYHLMPNLPGANPQSDLRSVQQLFDDPSYRPDALKFYPCVVVKSAELHQWWKDGRYQPYDDETLIELLIQMKQCVPPYVRIERVIRDIPSTSIESGCLTTNLREQVQQRMRARGLHCQCIRCRQVRNTCAGPWTLVRRSYEASGGREIFLSMEQTDRQQLASLLRLRIPSTQRSLGFLFDCAIIRELHTYGPHVPIHEQRQEAVQHLGFGQRLIAEAERLAREEFGKTQMAVIAGVGVRGYYRRLGYQLRDTYMVKTFHGA